MPSNVGGQEVTVKFYDPVDSDQVNLIGKENRKIGIYRGGYLTKNSNVSVSMSPAIFEIEDSGGSGDQVRITTSSTVTVTTFNSTKPYFVIRFPDVDDPNQNYAEFLALEKGSIGNYDLIVGKCNYSGSVLLGFLYAERSVPNVFDLFFKVEPDYPTASLLLRVRAGRLRQTNSVVLIPELYFTLIPPSSQKRIDLVYLVSSVVQVVEGAVGDPPVAPALPAGVPLAEVTLYAGQTTITEKDIKDIRVWLVDSIVAVSGDLLFTSNTGARPGWTDVSAQYNDKFIRISNQTPLASGGSDIHTHTLSSSNLPSHSHGLSTESSGLHRHTIVGNNNGNGGHGGEVANNGTLTAFANAMLNAGTHVHVITQNDVAGGLTGDSFSADNVPAYIKVRMFKKD